MDMNIALGVAGAVTVLALSTAGSAIGTGMAGMAAVGAWKKCYAQNRPAPFILLAYVGAPLTQTLYGMILMFVMINQIQASTVPGAGLAMLILGFFAGIPIGASAFLQGRTAAASADSQGETGQGFTNNLAALGIIETTAIFMMVFTLIAVSKLAA